MEDLSTEVLLKRKKFIGFLAGVFIGVGLVMVTLIIYDLFQDKEMSRSTMNGAVAALAGFWLPVYMLRKVNKELKRRKLSEGTNPQSKD